MIRITGKTTYGYRRNTDVEPELFTNLVAYWDMNGNGVDKVASITPILQTNVTYNNASILGTSASANASNAILRYADNDRFSFTTGSEDLPFSISCWVYFTSAVGFGNWLINKRDATSGGDEWQMYRAGSGGAIFFVKFQHNNNLIFQQCSSNATLFNTWYHVVVTDKGTANFNDMNIYINGANVTTTRQNVGGTYTRMNNGPSAVGLMNANWNPANGTTHLGRLDEVAIWKNRELTPQEVLYLYNSGIGRGYPL